MKNYLLLFVLALTAIVHAAGPDVKYKGPRTVDGHPDFQGVWSFSSDVPLERPASAADKKMFTREEVAAQKAAVTRAFEMIKKLAPVEDVGLSSFEFGGRIEDLRTSLITYPENGQLPKLVDGVRRVAGPAQIIAALSDPKAPPPFDLLASVLSGGKKDGPEDFSAAARCLFDGGDTPLVADFGGAYVQIIQAKDHVVLLTEGQTRIVPLDGRPHVSDKLRSWSGDSRGHWEGDTLVIDTRNFNRRTRSFGGAGNALEKVVTERFTRASKDRLEYEATIVDPKTFQDKVVVALPMPKVDFRIYEDGCHEGNYSMSNSLSAARAEEREAMKPKN